MEVQVPSWWMVENIIMCTCACSLMRPSFVPDLGMAVPTNLLLPTLVVVEALAETFLLYGLSYGIKLLHGLRIGVGVNFPHFFIFFVIAEIVENVLTATKVRRVSNYPSQ